MPSSLELGADVGGPLWECRGRINRVLTSVCVHLLKNLLMTYAHGQSLALLGLGVHALSDCSYPASSADFEADLQGMHVQGLVQSRGAAFSARGAHEDGHLRDRVPGAHVHAAACDVSGLLDGSPDMLASGNLVARAGGRAWTIATPHRTSNMGSSLTGIAASAWALRWAFMRGARRCILCFLQDTTIDLQSLQAVLDKAFEAAAIQLRQPAAQQQPDPQPVQQPDEQTEPQPDQQPEQQPATS